MLHECDYITLIITCFTIEIWERISVKHIFLPWKWDNFPWSRKHFLWKALCILLPPYEIEAIYTVFYYTWCIFKHNA